MKYLDWLTKVRDIVVEVILEGKRDFNMVMTLSLSTSSTVICGISGAIFYCGTLGLSTIMWDICLLN